MAKTTFNMKMTLLNTKKTYILLLLQHVLANSHPQETADIEEHLQLKHIFIHLYLAKHYKSTTDKDRFWHPSCQQSP